MAVDAWRGWHAGGIGEPAREELRKYNAIGGSLAWPDNRQVGPGNSASPQPAAVAPVIAEIEGVFELLARRELPSDLQRVVDQAIHARPGRRLRSPPCGHPVAQHVQVRKVPASERNIDRLGQLWNEWAGPTMKIRPDGGSQSISSPPSSSTRI
jgi:hypothetical protein